MSGIVLWISALAVAVALSLGVAQVGLAAVEQARAGTAADAAALAGAGAGERAAREAASQNGAELVSIQTSEFVTTVVVSYRRATVTASAERLVLPVAK